MRQMQQFNSTGGIQTLSSHGVASTGFLGVLRQGLAQTLRMQNPRATENEVQAFVNQTLSADPTPAFAATHCPPAVQSMPAPRNIIQGDSADVLGARNLYRIGVITGTGELTGTIPTGGNYSIGGITEAVTGITGANLLFGPQGSIKWSGAYFRCQRYSNDGTEAAPIQGEIIEERFPLSLRFFGNSLTNQVPGTGSGGSSSMVGFSVHGADPLLAHDITSTDPLQVQYTFPSPIPEDEMLLIEVSLVVLAVPKLLSDALLNTGMWRPRQK